MTHVTLEVQMTPDKAKEAIKRAGGDTSSMDEVMRVIELSTTRVQVLQNDIRRWIADMEGEGYHVTDAEIPVRQMR